MSLKVLPQWARRCVRRDTLLSWCSPKGRDVGKGTRGRWSSPLSCLSVTNTQLLRGREHIPPREVNQRGQALGHGGTCPPGSWCILDSPSAGFCRDDIPSQHLGLGWPLRHGPGTGLLGQEFHSRSITGAQAQSPPAGYFKPVFCVFTQRY